MKQLPLIALFFFQTGTVHSGPRLELTYLILLRLVLYSTVWPFSPTGWREVCRKIIQFKIGVEFGFISMGAP
jgi:hypothetical protein